MIELTPDLLSRYLATAIPEWSAAEVTRLDRLPLGASRETYRLDVRVNAAETLPLILRRDPPASLVGTDARTEYDSYRAIHGHGVPVPRMIHFETDTGKLGGAVMIAEDLRGFHNSEYQLQEPAWADRLPRIAEQMWGMMGTLAAVDVAMLDLSFMPPATVEGAAKQQLDLWVAKFRANATAPDPIFEAAVRELERTLPVAQKLAMVHGDFRAGNFLYDDDATVRAILDWEMAHVGDPLEDLAWSINRGFCFGKDDRRSGIAPREQVIAIWERASGLTADPAHLRWYELFSDVKAQALWVSAATVWTTSENKDVILGYASWWLQNTQNRAMLETMGRL
jgi:aminoglycoside phosphotransferase (APT) family kinase protein